MRYKELTFIYNSEKGPYKIDARISHMIGKEYPREDEDDGTVWAYEIYFRNGLIHSGTVDCYHFNDITIQEIMLDYLTNTTRLVFKFIEHGKMGEEHD